MPSNTGTPAHDTATRFCPDEIANIQPGSPQEERPIVWDGTPLRTKLTLLVALAAVGGSLVGIVEAHLGHAVMPLGVGLTGLMILMVWLAHSWVCRPFDRLLRHLQRIHTISRPGSLQAPATQRRDEIGQLAHAVHQIATAAMRDQFEARHLRRTLDHRIATATRRATRQLRQMTKRDPLTGLGNRRFLEENLQPLVDSVLASDSDLVCILMDIDNFKQVNDTRGHSKGDELLVVLASLIRTSIRRSDYAARLGGDEIILLLPNCTVDRSRRTAHRIAALFREHIRTAIGTDLGVGLSQGVASLQRDGIRHGLKLLERADANLYAAKRDGKSKAVGI